jgi:hypothetical protein
VREDEYLALTETMRPELLRIAARRCGASLAEDAVQMAVFSAWRDGWWGDASAETARRRLRLRTASRALDLRKSSQRQLALRRRLWVLLRHQSFRGAG